MLTLYQLFTFMQPRNSIQRFGVTYLLLPGIHLGDLTGRRLSSTQPASVLHSLHPFFAPHRDYLN